MDFVNLHVHTHYSILDGLNSPEEMVAAAVALGQKAIAITDHGVLSGHRDMQRQAKAAGIKPILGVEAYISETDRFDRRSKAKRSDGTSIYNHIVLLAKNQNGLVNLNRMSEIAWREGYYYKPRIDLELLSEHKEDIIVLSGCLSGMIPKAFEREDPERAEFIARWFQREFGDDFYLEIMADNPEPLNTNLLNLGDKLGISSVITSDSHYDVEENALLEEAMLIVSASVKPKKGFAFQKSREITDWMEKFNYLYPDRFMTFQKLSLHLRSKDNIQRQMTQLGHDREDIYENSLVIADKIGEYDYASGLDLLPRPKTQDPDALLRKKVKEGLKRLGLDALPEYVERADEELSVIEAKQFASYFIIQANTVQWAKSKDILIGPGRGSSAGSLVCYALGITDIDPIEYGLLFFRFLDVERDDWPDIDIDVEDRRRREVKNYLRKQYKNASSIKTFKFFKNKGVIRDAARVFRIPQGEVNKALNGVDAPVNEDFLKVFMLSPQGSDFAAKYPEVMELAEGLKGRIRESGVHPAGVVLSSKPISDYAPIETAVEPKDPTKTRIPVIGYDMHDVADIGMIKNDWLGLNTLSVISDTVKAVKERKGKDIVLRDIPLDDSKVYAVLTAGFTKGVFQSEKPASTSLIRDMGVESFKELVVSNALVRPGAAKTIGVEYIARKQGRQQPIYMHDILKEFTKETFGLILYQEQVMLACVHLGGMTMAEANKIRQIIGKKKDVHEFDQYKARFVEGASNHITKEAAELLWEDFEKHAGYSFNKSHAVAYSRISYWTAWLKYYYPVEFMWALMSNEGDNKKLTRYLIEAKRMGINVKLPHVETSEVNFSIQGDSIRFGLQQVKNISSVSAPKIIASRPYGSLEKLLETSRKNKSGINSKAISSLVAVGAASYDDNPRTGDESDNYYEILRIPRFRTDSIPDYIEGQTTRCDEFMEKGVHIIVGMVDEIQRTDTWCRIEILDETGGIGVFHDPNSMIVPGQMYLFLIADNRIHRFIELDDVTDDNHDPLIRYLKKDSLNIDDDQRVVVSFTTNKTKDGRSYGHVIMSNKDKELVKLLVFSKNYVSAMSQYRHGAVVKPVIGSMKSDGALFVDKVNGN